MKYIALIYSNGATDPKPGSEEFGRLIGEYQAATQKFIEDSLWWRMTRLNPSKQRQRFVQEMVN